MNESVEVAGLDDLGSQWTVLILEVLLHKAEVVLFYGFHQLLD